MSFFKPRVPAVILSPPLPLQTGTRRCLGGAGVSGGGGGTEEGTSALPLISFVWTGSPLRAQEGGRGPWGRIRPRRGEEVLCLLAPAWGFKGSGQILAPALGSGGSAAGWGRRDGTRLRVGGLGDESSPRLWPESVFFLGSLWDFQLHPFVSG